MGGAASIGKFGQFYLDNIKYVKIGETILTSAVDITGEGFQKVSGEDLLMRTATAVVTDYTSKLIGDWLSEKVQIVSPSTDDLPLQKHHFASNKHSKFTKEFQKILDPYGLSLDDDWNIQLLPHRGRHPDEYHKFVLKKMEKAAK